MRNYELTRTLKPLLMRLITVLGTLIVFNGSGAALAQSLSQLSVADQTAVQSICQPVHYRDGASAYRNCIAEQTRFRSQSDELTNTTLTFDERYAIQQTCQPEGALQSDAYRDCVIAENASVADIPVPPLSLLSEDENYALQQSCFDVQITQGVKAYRQCLNQAIRQLQAIPEPDLSALALLERNAIQLRCSALNNDAADYRSCLLEAVNGTPVNQDSTVVSPTAASPNEAVTELESATTVVTDEQTLSGSESNPELDILNTNEPASVERSDAQNSVIASISEQSDTVPISNVQVQENALSIAESLPVPSTDTTLVLGTVSNEVTTNVVDIATDNALPSTDNNNLADTAVSAVQTAELAASDTAPQNRATTASNNNASTSAIAAEKATQPASGFEITTDNTAISSSPIDKAKELATKQWLQLQSTVGDLTGMNQLILLGAMVLPMLLAGFWLMMRGRESEPAYTAPAHAHPLAERVGPSVQRRVRATSDSDLDELSQSLDFTAQADEMFGSEATTTNTDSRTSSASATTRDNRAAVDADIAAAMHHSADLDVGQLSDIDTAVTVRHPMGNMTDEQSQTEQNSAAHEANYTPAAQRSAGFADWLASHEQSDQLPLMIEFLIYWVAYADERYETELKRRIFSMPNPDDHDLIKRWVLKQDVFAFAHCAAWLQSNSSEEQRQQILNLLMALLVNENALTPAQNTLLRFFSDIFGQGQEQLDEQYRQSFAHPMPPLPRVDKPNWWKRQSRDSLIRWDARWVSAQALDLQYRVKLGLALRGPLSEDTIRVHFNRAAARCNPARFAALGEREQLLAARQISKFEVAQDALLEVVA